MPKEQWRDVAGYEGLYAVSDQGCVRSLGCEVVTSQGILRRYRGLILCPSRSNGYLLVGLSKNSNQVQIFVHRLVAWAFLEPPLEGQDTVNHKNGIKSDNSASNLEWASRSENMQHARRTGLYASSRPIK